jgi:hypothetical protein
MVYCHPILGLYLLIQQFFYKNWILNLSHSKLKQNRTSENNCHTAVSFESPMLREAIHKASLHLNGNYRRKCHLNIRSNSLLRLGSNQDWHMANFSLSGDGLQSEWVNETFPTNSIDSHLLIILGSQE